MSGEWKSIHSPPVFSFFYYFSGHISDKEINEIDPRGAWILTQEEMMNALGLGKSGLVIGGKIGDPPKGLYLGLGGDYQMHEWSDVLHRLPLSKMNNLDALFEILDIQLRGTRAEDTAAEIREVLERVRQEVQE